MDATVPRLDPDPDLLTPFPGCPRCCLPWSEQGWSGGDLGWVLLKRGKHNWGASARAEGESRVLGGAECDQGSEREQCTYINSLKENVSAQTQIIEGKKKKQTLVRWVWWWVDSWGYRENSALTGRNDVLKQKVLTGSNQKGAQRKLVMKFKHLNREGSWTVQVLALEPRRLREHKHLEEEHGVVVTHEMDSQGQQSATGIAEREGRKRRAWAMSSIWGKACSRGTSAGRRHKATCGPGFQESRWDLVIWADGKVPVPPYTCDCRSPLRIAIQQQWYCTLPDTAQSRRKSGEASLILVTGPRRHSGDTGSSHGSTGQPPPWDRVKEKNSLSHPMSNTERLAGCRDLHLAQQGNAVFHADIHQCQMSPVLCYRNASKNGSGTKSLHSLKSDKKKS